MFIKEIEDLKLELFQAEQTSDKTPGALLFFAALYDPAAITAMHNLLNELKQLKGVAECKEHMDFTFLRQKILICLSNSPSLERLLNKFSKMHSTWTQNRAKMFSIRNQVGGDADAAYACPLCSNDSRLNSLHNNSSSKSNENVKLIKHTHPNSSDETKHIPKAGKSAYKLPLEDFKIPDMLLSRSSASLSYNEHKKRVTDKIKTKNW